MKMNILRYGFLVFLSVAPILAPAQQPSAIRIGHFPNITHAQALLARAHGTFEKALSMPVQWTTFNAGPSAVEALFADAIDATYIGPNPAINGFLKSKGKSFQIVAGAASGGAALVVRSDSGISSEKDFDGKILATPQLGNTQDVAARAWLRSHGYEVKERGGTVTVLPLANADQLLMFQRREIDAAWTVEPWVSRLELEAGGRVLLEESTLWPRGKYVTAVLVVSRRLIENYPKVVEKLVAAHIELTEQIEKEKAALADILNSQIQQLTGKALPPAVVTKALERVEFTWEPMEDELARAAQLAFEAGFIREQPQLQGLYNLDFLHRTKEVHAPTEQPAP